MPQRQSRRSPCVYVKPSLAAVSVVAGSRSGRGGRVAGAARAVLWPLAELVRGARGRGGLECRPRAPGPWWTSESEALAQAPSRQALACRRVDRAISSLAVVGTVLYTLRLGKSAVQRPSPLRAHAAVSGSVRPARQASPFGAPCLAVGSSLPPGQRPPASAPGPGLHGRGRASAAMGAGVRRVEDYLSKQRVVSTRRCWTRGGL